MLGVSGLRGTIGGSLTPEVAMRWANAVACYFKNSATSPINGTHYVMVLGRDTRPSGPFVRDAVVSALMVSGVEVIDLGIVTTPGVAMMVTRLKADAGMVITASHNPIIWNGIKLLDSNGIALPPTNVDRIIELFHKSQSSYVTVDKLVAPKTNEETNAYHVHRVLNHVDVLGIASKRFKVVLDSVNGAGGVPGATLLSKLGCMMIQINAEPHGRFAHEPEPMAKNLVGLSDEVRKQKAAIGFAQDPDADRLAIVDENGTFIGEEYTLALAARYILAKKPNAIAAANLSTSRMIDDIAAETGGRVVRTPVGEANVVHGMINAGATIGGEGNGGVIDPRIVGGRDSLVAMAYVLGLLAREGKPLSAIVDSIPKYTIIKDKFECKKEDAGRAVQALVEQIKDGKVDTQHGIRID
ncbi:MAG TPA: phosphoglucosamine mutase, partial [Tepidisphaeraceae bacterium]|nr:phosphoglucosamine mutase [Tepidisphaeraceae bacterium]